MTPPTRSLPLATSPLTGEVGAERRVGVAGALYEGGCFGALRRAVAAAGRRV